MCNIYFASKLHHASTGRAIRTEWRNYGLFIVSDWLDHVGEENKAPPEQFAIHWLRDEYDVRRADLVLLYIPLITDDPRGALVECGMAIAQGKPVLPVGVDHPALGTWRYHPLVLARVRTLDEALDRLKWLRNLNSNPRSA